MEESLYNWQHLIAPELPLLRSPAGSTTPLKNVHLELGDDLLFEMLVSELDATYLRIDEAFQEAGINLLRAEPYSCTTPKTHLTSDDTLRSFAEMVEVEVSPFDFELVNRVADSCFEKVSSQSPDRMVYNRDWGFEDIATEKHRLIRVFNGVEIYVHMLLASKKYEFEDQVINVWRYMFKCDGQFPEAYVQETGWMIMTNLASQSNGTGTHPMVGSITKYCVHLEPKRFTAPSTVIKAETDTMTTLMLNSYQGDV